jgi:hypothetical protein
VTPKTLKLLAASYLVKTLLLGAAWLAVPDLPQRAAAKLREAWSWVAATDDTRQSALSKR